ncbi:MAG: MAPEG family protein, partial [Myxococcota bacterium]
VEGSAMFVPVALAVSLGGLASSMTAAAAIAYVGFRVLYSGAYLIGIPYLRSLLWTGGLVSIGVVGWPLVGFG